MEAFRQFLSDAVPPHSGARQAPATVVCFAGGGMTNSESAELAAAVLGGGGTAASASDETSSKYSLYGGGSAGEGFGAYGNPFAAGDDSDAQRRPPCATAFSLAPSAPVPLAPLLRRHGLFDVAANPLFSSHCGAAHGQANSDAAALPTSSSAVPPTNADTAPLLIPLCQRGSFGHSAATDAEALMPCLAAPSAVLVWAVGPCAVPAQPLAAHLRLGAAYKEECDDGVGGVNEAKAASLLATLRSSLAAALAPLTDALSVATILSPPPLTSFHSHASLGVDVSGSPSPPATCTPSSPPRSALVIRVRVALGAAVVSAHRGAIAQLLEAAIAHSAAPSPSPFVACGRSIGSLLSLFFGRVAFDVSPSVVVPSSVASAAAFPSSSSPSVYAECASVVVRLAAEALLDGGSGAGGNAAAKKARAGGLASSSNAASPFSSPPIVHTSARTVGSLSDRLTEAIDVAGRLSTSAGLSGGGGSLSCLAAVPFAGRAWAGSFGAAAAVGAALAASSSAPPSASAAHGAYGHHHGNAPSSSSTIATTLSHNDVSYATANGYVTGLLRLLRGGGGSAVGRSSSCVPSPANAATPSVSSPSPPAGGSNSSDALQRLREGFLLQDATALLHAVVAAGSAASADAKQNTAAASPSRNIATAEGALSPLPRSQRPANGLEEGSMRRSSMPCSGAEEEEDGEGGMNRDGKAPSMGVRSHSRAASAALRSLRGGSEAEAGSSSFARDASSGHHNALSDSDGGAVRRRSNAHSCTVSDRNDNDDDDGFDDDEDDDEAGLSDSTAFTVGVANRLRAALLGGGAASEEAQASFMAAAAAIEASRADEAAAVRQEAREQRRRVRVSSLAHALLDELAALDVWVASEMPFSAA